MERKEDRNCYEMGYCECRDCEGCQWSDEYYPCDNAVYYTEMDALEGGCELCINWLDGPGCCKYDLLDMIGTDDMTNCH